MLIADAVAHTARATCGRRLMGGGVCRQQGHPGGGSVPHRYHSPVGRFVASTVTCMTMRGLLGRGVWAVGEIVIVRGEGPCAVICVARASDRHRSSRRVTGIGIYGAASRHLHHTGHGALV